MNKPRIKICLTNFGKACIFLSVFLLFSAQNTGNNLLFVMASCFIAAFIIILYISYRNISGLEPILEAEEEIYAGEEFSIKCRLKEFEGRAHYCIAFEDDFTGKLEAEEIIYLRTRIRAEKRGIYKLKNFALFSFHPFGLIFIRALLPQQSVFVAPKKARVIPELIEKEIGGAIQKFEPGKEGDYWMQKPYQSGEDASLINWTISARSNFEWVLIKSINYGLPEKLYFNFSGLTDEVFEDCLKIVTSIIFKLRENGSHAFIWARQEHGSYNWMSVTDNYSTLLHWLADLKEYDKIPPPTGDCRGIDFNEILSKINA
ncbi:MAG: hypothetical protein ACQETH_00605 [Candidatus Rifleibacteriota bacterium]